MSLGIGIDICTYRGIGKESFPRSSAQFCGAILWNSAKNSLMVQFWRSFFLNRTQYQVISAAVWRGVTSNWSTWPMQPLTWSWRSMPSSATLLELALPMWPQQSRTMGAVRALYASDLARRWPLSQEMWVCWRSDGSLWQHGHGDQCWNGVSWIRFETVNYSRYPEARVSRSRMRPGFICLLLFQSGREIVVLDYDQYKHDSL